MLLATLASSAYSTLFWFVFSDSAPPCLCVKNHTPLAGQRRIVAKVDEPPALVDALETQLAAERAATTLLAAAVSGLAGGE